MALRLSPLLLPSLESLDSSGRMMNNTRIFSLVPIPFLDNWEFIYISLSNIYLHSKAHLLNNKWKKRKN